MLSNGSQPAPNERVTTPTGAPAASSTRVLVAVLLGVGATTFPISVFAATLPSIAREFDTSEATIAWVVSLPTLGFAIAMPVLGKLGDIHGHRKVYLWGFGTSSLLAALTALAWSAPSLIALRTLGQVCGAATTPASMALIMTSFASTERVRAMGWWSLVTAGAPTIGLVIGGPMIDLIGWRPLFLIQAAAGALAVIGARGVLPETPRRQSTGFDLPGAAALAAGVASALVGLNQSQRLGWTAPLVVGCFAAAPVFLAMFVVIERRSASPLIPLEMFRRRNFTVPVVAQFFMQTAYMGGFVLSPFLLDTEFGYSPAGITTVMVARPLAFSLAGPLSGRVSVAIGERRTGIIGTSSMAISMAVLAYGAGTQNILAVIVGLVLSGAGNGFCQPPYQASLANAVDAADLGIASAAKNVVGQIGAAVGITLMTSLRTVGETPAAGFAAAFWTGAGIAAVAVVVAFALADTQRVRDVTIVPSAGRSVRSAGRVRRKART